ncbi:hypothetical protein BBJ29_009804, partial [Phytophthora kernoviae]
KTSDGKNDVKVCQWSQGSKTPSNLGDGPSGTLCQYSESDVHINGDVSQSTTQSETTSSASTSKETASSSDATPTTNTSTDASGAGTVSPADSDSLEQSFVNFASSNATEQEPTDGSTDVSQTAIHQSSVASSTSTSASGSTTKSSDNGAQNEEQTVASSASGSSALSTATSTASSSNTISSTAASTASAASSADTTQTASTNSTGSIPDGTWPTSTGTVTYTEPYTIKAGEVFDGKMQTFDRSDITCSEGEGQKDTAVFLVEAGGTLKNAIIGKNQKEGVHCDDHDCTIENVWWDDVCEDALSIKGGSASSVTTVTNCGARYASDKVVQHNGYGTVKIDGFYAQEFGKLYRSCGTCGDIPRKVFLSNVYAVDPLVSVVTVNKNYGDQAKFSNIYVKTSDGKNDVKVCQWSQGSKTPSNLGDGPSGTLCQYSESDVHINE